MQSRLVKKSARSAYLRDGGGLFVGDGGDQADGFDLDAADDFVVAQHGQAGDVGTDDLVDDGADGGGRR